MSQGEEEGPECDMVEPIGSRQKWELKYWLFRADEKSWSDLIHTNKKPRKSQWLKEKDSWSWERPGCLITSIYSLLEQNWRFQLLTREENGPGIQSGPPRLSKMGRVRTMAIPGSVDDFGSTTLTYSTYSNWLDSVVRTHLPGVWPEAGQCSYDNHTMKGLNGEWAPRTSGVLDALAVWAGYFMSLPRKMVRWRRRWHPHGKRTCSSALTKRWGRDRVQDDWIAGILFFNWENCKIMRYSRHTKKWQIIRYYNLPLCNQYPAPSDLNILMFLLQMLFSKK